MRRTSVSSRLVSVFDKQDQFEIVDGMLFRVKDLMGRILSPFRSTGSE